MAFSPAGGFWPTLIRAAPAAGVVDCPPLPRDGPLGWWHNAVGTSVFDPGLGGGIKVGVLDTGLGRHACLQHAVAIGSFIGGQVDLSVASTSDHEGHGTHVAGTIGGRPAEPGHYAGIALAAALFCARVFPPGGAANNADLSRSNHRSK